MQQLAFLDAHTKVLDKMSRSFRNEFWQAFLAVLFPERCLACSAGLKAHPEISFCPACREEVRMLREPFCTVCGKPFDDAAGESHRCSHCLKNAWHFKQARAVVRYLAPVAEAVKAFKYNGKMHGLATFAALSREYFQHHSPPQPDLILPVPLHPRRLRQRGFNQALILCRNIFPDSKNKIDPHLLTRQFWTRTQTGLSGVERRKNVRNAFRVERPEAVTSKRILLVDDVFTTGATVNECARILMKNRAAEVEVFTFARAIGK